MNLPATADRCYLSGFVGVIAFAGTFVACLISFLAVFAFALLNEVARDLEDPFGHAVRRMHGHPALVLPNPWQQRDCEAHSALILCLSRAAQSVANRRSPHRFQRALVDTDSTHLPERWLVSTRQDNRRCSVPVRAIRDRHS